MQKLFFKVSLSVPSGKKCKWCHAAKISPDQLPSGVIFLWTECVREYPHLRPGGSFLRQLAPLAHSPLSNTFQTFPSRKKKKNFVSSVEIKGLVSRESFLIPFIDNKCIIYKYTVPSGVRLNWCEKNDDSTLSVYEIYHYFSYEHNLMLAVEIDDIFLCVYALKFFFTINSQSKTSAGL